MVQGTPTLEARVPARHLHAAGRKEQGQLVLYEPHKTSWRTSCWWTSAPEGSRKPIGSCDLNQSPLFCVSYRGKYSIFAGWPSPTNIERRPY